MWLTLRLSHLPLSRPECAPWRPHAKQRWPSAPPWSAGSLSRLDAARAPSLCRRCGATLLICRWICRLACVRRTRRSIRRLSRSTTRRCVCVRERERAPRSEELPRNSVLITAHMTSLLTRSHTHYVMPAHNCRPARWKRRSKQHSATSLNRGTRA